MDALPARSLLRFLVPMLLLLAVAPATATTILSDPAGDAGGGPDLLELGGGFTGAQLLLDASFAAGSLDPATLAFHIALDVDLDSGTGTGCDPGVFPCGAEFGVIFNSQLDADEAFLVDLVARTLVTPVALVTRTDGLSLTVPLGGGGLPDDGEARFGMVVGIPTSSTSFAGSDFLPDSAPEGTLGGPTTLVPEPASALLLGAALAALAAGGARRRAGVSPSR